MLPPQVVEARERDADAATRRPSGLSDSVAPCGLDFRAVGGRPDIRQQQRTDTGLVHGLDAPVDCP